jgi:hypothetical protein
LAGDSTIISVLALVANDAAAFEDDPPARERVPSRRAAAAATNVSPPRRPPSPFARATRANARARDDIHPRAARVDISVEARARVVVQVEVEVARDDDDDDALGVRARMHATRGRGPANETDDATVEVARDAPSVDARCVRAPSVDDDRGVVKWRIPSERDSTRRRHVRRETAESAKVRAAHLRRRVVGRPNRARRRRGREEVERDSQSNLDRGAGIDGRTARIDVFGRPRGVDTHG